jgi:glucuronokinase
MIVRTHAHARVGLIGNPSDGYHGKTIAFTIGDFAAEAVLYESPELELRPAAQDDTTFAGVRGLLQNVRRNGYYGGVRLLKAAITKFVDHCDSRGIDVPERNFTLRYTTTIPRQVGLGGSSAIITATMRALMAFYDVRIPDDTLPNVVLAAETEELGLTAGLQDRVVQAYGGLVFMDFDRSFMDQHGHGVYDRLPVELLPTVYLAYRHDLSKESSTTHIMVRDRYSLGDRDVVDTMAEIASLAEPARAAMEAGDHGELARLIDRNFDLRARIFDLRPDDRRMVETARAAGASCKFCGSGGAVVGTCPDEAALAQVRKRMQQAGYEFIVPRIVSDGSHEAAANAGGGAS